MNGPLISTGFTVRRAAGAWQLKVRFRHGT
ncbi:hypothetical protein JO379_000064 [Streptomyces syringium]|uniref:Integrase n=1 Tax=Streptomyces syringium TaxID=76729 RepID=A0ABS4XW80_9ACTN|nr:hypothetical protein [Streptomyces syringium]